MIKQQLHVYHCELLHDSTCQSWRSTRPYQNCRQSKSQDAEKDSKAEKDRKPISWQAWKGPSEKEEEAAGEKRRSDRGGERPSKKTDEGTRGKSDPKRSEKSDEASRERARAREQDRPRRSERVITLRNDREMSREQVRPEDRDGHRRSSRHHSPKRSRSPRRPTPPRHRPVSPVQLRYRSPRRRSPVAARRHSARASRSSKDSFPLPSAPLPGHAVSFTPGPRKHQPSLACASTSLCRLMFALQPAQGLSRVPNFQWLLL